MILARAVKRGAKFRLILPEYFTPPSDFKPIPVIPNLIARARGDFIVSSHSNSVTSNDIFQNKNGIYVQGYSDHNYIKGNEISDNEYGIYLDVHYESGDEHYYGDPDDNYIIRNEIEDSDLVGIHLDEYGVDNLIYDNDIEYSGLFDYQDLNYPNNFWKENECDTSDPPGLCEDD